LTVSDVQRDGSGNIVVSGGTLDPDTKNVVSTASWNVNSARANSVVLTTYLTNWKTAVPTPTPTSTPTPTPANTCDSYAKSQGYSLGTCRQNASKCTQNGETHLTGGDQYCTGGPSEDTCCGLP